ncbi:T9SS type A sorting domain-containing protein [Hymenobacter norwichensis]|uniref:T9SS type A sorting domain-containing protein n=1 Tax=Hymenobacter norwichensis TaxID=223903 RepID=UPI00042A8C90|nr:T9SS type A sorting domain-containing protein [Hymenobacter norwichensis]
MKHLVFLGCLGSLLLGLVSLTQAQTPPFSITQATFPAYPNVLERYLPVHRSQLSSFALPQLGANQLWDYGYLVADSTVLENTYQAPAATNPFPTATRSYTIAQQTTQQYAVAVYGLWASFAGQQYEAITPAGLQRVGYTLQPQQWRIRSTDTTANDVLRLPAQTVAYQGSAYRLQFPVSGIKTAAYRAEVHLQATVRQLNLSAAPVRLVRSFTQLDSVAGFGTLRLPAPAGGQASFPAILVRTILRETDSLYLGQQPAPALLLRTLGMQQGQGRDILQTVFYRENSSQPALQFYHGSSFQTVRTFFGLWFSAEPSLNSIVASSRGSQPLAGSLRAYPNPVVSGEFTVELAGSAQPLQLIVRDLVGRQLARAATLPGHATTALRGLPAGVYLVEATAPDGQRGTMRLQVQ